MIIWFTIPATSGMEGYQNSQFQNMSDLGPIPGGAYSINLSLDHKRIAKADPNSGELLRGNGIQRIPTKFTTNDGRSWEYSAWGTMRARLNPSSSTNTYGRHSFYIHDSHKGYSHGCIEVGAGFFPKLINYSLIKPSINVYVQYSFHTSTRGNTKW